jgi:hypothetical protein
MIEFCIGVFLGIMTTCLITSAKTADLLSEIDELQRDIKSLESQNYYLRKQKSQKIENVKR